MALYRNVRYGTERDRARGTSRASLIGSSTVVSPACKRGGDTGFETAASAPVPKVLISPHAGYIYSGRVAAAGYRWLALVRERITRAVLLGPSHFVGFHGLAAASAGGWQTRWAACRSTALGRAPNRGQADRSARRGPCNGHNISGPTRNCSKGEPTRSPEPPGVKLIAGSVACCSPR